MSTDPPGGTVPPGGNVPPGGTVSPGSSVLPNTGDPEHLDVLATRIGRLASVIAQECLVMGRATEVQWVSTAADRFRAVVTHQVAGLRQAQERATDGAQALHRHAQAVREQDAALRAAATAALTVAARRVTALQAAASDVKPW